MQKTKVKLTSQAKSYHVVTNIIIYHIVNIGPNLSNNSI